MNGLILARTRSAGVTRLSELFEATNADYRPLLSKANGAERLTYTSNDFWQWIIAVPGDSAHARGYIADVVEIVDDPEVPPLTAAERQAFLADVAPGIPRTLTPHHRSELAAVFSR